VGGVKTLQEIRHPNVHMEVSMQRHFSACLFAVIALGLAFFVNSLHKDNMRLQLALDRQQIFNNLRMRSNRPMQNEAVIKSLEQQVQDLRLELVQSTLRIQELEALTVQNN
jgi:hypothetical protein